MTASTDLSPDPTGIRHASWHTVPREPDELDLSDWRAPSGAPGGTGYVTRALDDGLVQLLQTVATRIDLPTQHFVTAVFAAWLARHTGRRDLLFGVRFDESDARAVLPVRIDADPPADPLLPYTVQALAGACGAAVAAAAADRVPLDEMPWPEAPGTGFSHAMTATLDVVEPGPGWPGRELTAQLGTVLRMTVAIPSTPGGGRTAEVALAYPEDRFPLDIAERLTDRFLRMLRQASGKPTTALDDLDVFLPDEQVVLAGAERGPARAIVATTVPEMFRVQAARFADRLAAADDRGGSLTYAELDLRSDALARRLAGMGVRAESRCAVILDRSVEAVVALLGIVKAGGAFVPIDPQMPLMRMTSLLDDAGIEIVVTDEDRAATLSLGDRQTVTSWTVDDPDAQTPAAAVTPGHLAYVIYTSGSTGMPKGVLVEHGSITHFVEMVREFFELTPDDRVAQCAALWFDVSVFEIFGALLIGASVHIAGDDTKLAPGALQHFFRDQAVTTLMTTPSLLEALDPDALPDLRVMSVGGEAFTADLTNRWAPGRRFINGYGPAEATVEVVAKVVTEPTSSAPPIGVPLAGHTAYALDHRMRRVPFGVPGELYVGGPGVARGYLGRPGQTGGVFVPDLFAGSPGERLYRTGDLVRRLPNGELQYLGRVDRQVKVRGMRVEPSEIEQWLLRHPAVSRVAVVSTRDHHGDTRLVGYVVCDGAADPEDIRSFGADWLPTHMVPAEIVVVSSIPTTSSGKVDVAALVAAQPQPAPAEQPAAPADVRTPLQRDVSAIVCDILGRDGIAVDDDLFAVGGNSLQVLRILSRVRAAYGVVLAPQDFFDDPTVDGICAAISAEPAHV